MGKNIYYYYRINTNKMPLFLNYPLKYKLADLLCLTALNDKLFNRK